MSISAIGSSTVAAIASRRPAEATEVKTGGRDHDGDADDGGASVKAAPTTVNTSGQVLGQMVNVKA